MGFNPHPLPLPHHLIHTSAFCLLTSYLALISLSPTKLTEFYQGQE